MAFSIDNIGKNCYINISEDANIEDSLYGTIIGYYKNTDKNEEYYFVSINGEVKRIYDDSLINIIEDGSGGSSDVTPASIVTATGQMNDDQKSQTRTNLGVVSTATMGNVYNRLDALEGTTVTVEGATPTITPADNHIYQCGELTSLTITNPTATGAYSIVFTSGATATTTTIPATILGLEDFAAEANTLYEINVLDNRAVVGSWAVSA